MGRVYRKHFLSIKPHLIRIIQFFDKTPQLSQDIVPEIYDVGKLKLSVVNGLHSF